MQLVEPLLARPKVATRWSGWQKRVNHAGHLIAVAELAEHNGTTIPGVTMQLEVKDATSVVSCLFLFGIMALESGKRGRLYQLEVAPNTKRTHNGKVIIYGPHEHVGDLEPTQITDPVVNCESWDACALWFFTRASVVPFEIPNPFEP